MEMVCHNRPKPKLNRLEFTMQAAGSGVWEHLLGASGKMGAALGDLGQG